MNRATPLVGAVERSLREGRTLGLLGPAPVELHLRHACGFLEVLGAPPETLLDLGCGAGVPGLVLAALLPHTKVVLLDSNLRKTSFLARTVLTLGLSERVTVLRGRAEEVAHDPIWREAMGVVVARSFGPPATAAECGAGLVRRGGVMVVSDPPAPEQADSDPCRVEQRWPPDGLGTLGLVPRAGVVGGGFSFEILDKVALCPQRYPRRNGLPRRRPLF